MVDSTLFPVSEEFNGTYHKSQLGFRLKQKVAETQFDEIDIALIGIGNENPNDANAVRRLLYQYYWHFNNLKVRDLGDFILGKETEQDMHQLSELLKWLMGQGVTVILFGGNEQAWKTCYAAYEVWGRPLNFVMAGRDMNWLTVEETTERVLHEDSYMAHYAHIANQLYFTNNKALATLHKHHFWNMRLGDLKQDLKETEPLFRQANAFAFNANCVQSSFIKSYNEPSPNGLSGEESCAVARYAGMGSDLKLFCLHNFKGEDVGSAQNIAQMIWYVIEGFEFRVAEDPLQNPQRFTKYITDIDTHTPYHLVFYKSLDTEKWWMHIPVEEPKKYHRSTYLIPCSYKDYQLAQSGEIPDRWLESVAKLG
ncbi:MAG: hypothetical protein KDC92_01885 [Bacteroidetes bacterium]|nr:hypothetical protein [Bacteroidota bacterium]